MIFKEALFALKSKLKNIEDGDIEARYILEKVTGINYCEMLFKSDSNLDSETFNEAVALAERRLKGEPIQYILGAWDFMDFTFKVGEGVLIPRPETEILVEHILNEISNKSQPVIYDLCSGSGCIGLSIRKMHSDSQVYMIEKSDNAMIYLKENCERLCKNLSGAVVIQGDILYPDSFDMLPQADVIVSNPPYIKSGEISTLQREVFYEPHMALDGGKDGLIFYRVLISEWSKKLKKDGFMAFECGEDQAEDICELFRKNNFDSRVICDYNNIQRIVTGRRI